MLTVAVAVAASPLLPVGLARLAEPDLGVSVDGAALATGFLATAALVMALAGAAAWRSSRLATSPAAAVPQPAEVANLQRVADLPAVLGGFLGLLATLAVGHGIVSGVRRRRRDLGVLQAMGFVRLQVSAAVAWQASILALVGATAGLPLGVAFGRWAWLVLAGPMGVVPAPVVPTLAVLFAVPAAVLVANLVALLPARVATRMPPAAALRAE